MTADKELMYWMNDPSWYRINKETGKYELTDAAPERAKKSFELSKISRCINN
jgi:hypothetical protein